jgi:hypothetical protein
VPDLRYVPILVTCTFPRLHRFECYLSLCAGLASFLNRHPTIYLLQLSPRDRLTPDPNPPPVVLPALSYFIGNNECLMKVIGHASLRTAIVSWEVGQQTVEECIAALEKSSANSLKVLSCRRRGWNIDLVDTVSTRLPDLLVLSITNLLIVDQPSDVCQVFCFRSCVEI